MGKKSFTPASGGSSETTLPADDIEYNAAGDQVKKKPSASGDVKLSDLGSNGSGSMEVKSYPVCCISARLCSHIVFLDLANVGNSQMLYHVKYTPSY